MSIVQYIDIIFAIIVWAAALLLVKPKRIAELLPVSLIAVIVLFAVDIFFTTLGLYRFNNPLLPIGGIPFFHLIWSTGGAIVIMNYMKREFSKKLIMIFFFTIISGLFGYVSEVVGGHSHLNNFNEVYNIALDFVSLSFFVFISEGLFSERIYHKA